jgi:hypothetical protein
VGVNGHWYVEIRKQAFWRGSPHQWVNRYVMSGAQPSAADATSVITALKNIEDHVYPAIAAGAGIGFIDGRAYPSGKGTSFAQVSYNESGAAASATGFSGPTSAYTTLKFNGTLENCLVIETRLNGLSSTGKPVDTRKFFRGLIVDGEAGGAGQIGAQDLGLINTEVLPWQTGVGANNWVVIGPSGAQAAQPPAALSWIGNRQVPKGRKRSTTSTTTLFRLLRLGGSDSTDATALADDAVGIATL